MEEIKIEAEYLLTGYEQGGIEYIKAAANKGTNRITIISADGSVIYDSFVNVTEMENHTDRTEIAKAYSEGRGSDIRSSATSGEKTYYYALLAENGNVIRVAATMDALTKVLSNSVSLFLGLLLFSTIAVIIVSTKITDTIITKNIPNCAAAPKRNILGLERSGPKSIIAPIPIKSKSGIASDASIQPSKSHSIIPVT